MQFSSNKFQRELHGLLYKGQIKTLFLRFSFYRKLEPILYMAISYSLLMKAKMKTFKI